MAAPLPVLASSYTFDQCEAALCLWEALLNADASGCALAKALLAREGYSSARHTVMSWADECELDWQRAREIDQALEPFDWEHCPAWLAFKLAGHFPDVWQAIAYPETLLPRPAPGEELYSVLLTRDCTQSAPVNVFAGDQIEAEHKAVELARGGEVKGWAHDAYSGAQSYPYVTSCEVVR